MSKQRVHVLIAGNDRSTRRLLGMLLAGEEDLAVVGETEGGPGAAEMIERLRPDVALVDCNGLGPDVLQLVTAMRDRSGDAGIVVAGIYCSYAARVLEAGADAFILKDAGREALLEAIRRVASGLPQHKT